VKIHQNDPSKNNPFNRNLDVTNWMGNSKVLDPIVELEKISYVREKTKEVLGIEVMI
jgi:hypothetical protein